MSTVSSQDLAETKTSSMLLADMLGIESAKQHGWRGWCGSNFGIGGVGGVGL